MTEQELMLTEVRGCRRVDLYTDRRELTAEESVRYNAMEARRKNGEPLQYILGSCEFMGLKFLVDERVLIPRPETELLVEAALLQVANFIARPINILDLGTGSGNIAISLAKNLEHSKITTIDISAGALELAAANAQLNGVKEKISFCQSDLYLNLPKPLEAKDFFDMIISNPPYILSGQLSKLAEDVQREPKVALDGGADGLDFYRRIILGAAEFLKPGGTLALEIDDRHRPAIEKIFSQEKRFKVVSCQKDYSHQERIILAELN